MPNADDDNCVFSTLYFLLFTFYQNKNNNTKTQIYKYTKTQKENTQNRIGETAAVAANWQQQKVRINNTKLQNATSKQAA